MSTINIILCLYHCIRNMVRIVMKSKKILMNKRKINQLQLCINIKVFAQEAIKVKIHRNKNHSQLHFSKSIKQSKDCISKSENREGEKASVQKLKIKNRIKLICQILIEKSGFLEIYLQKGDTQHHALKKSHIYHEDYVCLVFLLFTFTYCKYSLHMHTFSYYSFIN